MKLCSYRLACLAWAVSCGTTFLSAQSFSYGLRLESPQAASLDEDLTITGETGSEFEVLVELTLTSADIPRADGVQGWSLGVWHAGLELDTFTRDGTAAASIDEGGFFDPDPKQGGFAAYQRIDPEEPDNNGRRGVVQAVVLSFRRPSTLPPNSRQVVGRHVYRGVIEAEGRTAFIRYQNGLRGKGQPVGNDVTYLGETFNPSLASRNISIGEGVGSEADNCDDGLDNDRDGFTDARDPDCFGSGNEVEVHCSDGLDDDGDGRIDCDDSDCLGRSNCADVEDCDDGLDNDRDGLIDCDDPGCSLDPNCRDPEVCDDGVDNDLDSRIDCLDPDCFGVGGCGFPEVCDDGIDNDLDGDTDCDDSQCSMLLACRDPEDCENGVDDDFDGLADCEDLDCAGVGDCPPAEICDNGIDDDEDGLTDCADPSCAGGPTCAGGEGGALYELVLTSPGAIREDVATAALGGDGGPAGGAGRISSRNVLDVTTETGAFFEVTTFIVPSGGPQARGVQGWSISVGHDRNLLSLVSAPTIEGTDAGELISSGFEKSEAANASDRARAAGGEGAVAGGEPDGFISAVVLSFTQPITLDPSRAQSVARAGYGLTNRLGRPSDDDAVGFLDGLRGSGQPVNNVLTVGGATVVPEEFVPIVVRRVADDAFLRGDANDDGRVNLADAVWILSELFRAGPPTRCPRAADVDADGSLLLSDAVYLMRYRFLRGPVIPAPFPSCGRRSTGTSLDCAAGTVSFCE